MAMSRNRKLIVVTAVVVGLITIVVLSKAIRPKEGQPVQTSKVERRARIESKVTASGEIRPVNFYDLTAQVAGRVDQIYVNEGDAVKKNQPLVKVDPTQYDISKAGGLAGVQMAQADANNSQMAVTSAQTAVNQAKSNLSAAESDLVRDKAALRFQKNEYDRNEKLIEQGVISKSVFDSVKSQFEQQQAVVSSQEARVTQLKQQLEDSELSVTRAKAALESAVARVKQNESNLDMQVDQLKRTITYSPIEGVVSSLPVKMGTFVLANFSSTPLLTVADMAQINAEIKVDETDIANVAIGQIAEVKVDALGDTKITGKVIEKAASAITRSGQTISQSTGGSQEAKDFVVKIRLEPTDEVRQKLRPGMSSTAVITTATVENALSIPLQAIVPREVSNGNDSQKADQPSASGISHKQEVEGVFVFGKDAHAHFTKVDSGIKGEQEIEIKSGVNEGDEIVTGPYKTLRSLKDGDAVSRESKPDASPSPK
jgi:HlyD family secretion protein